MTILDSTAPNGILGSKNEPLIATFSSDAAYLTHRDFLKRLGNPHHTSNWVATPLGEFLRMGMIKRGLTARDFWIYPGSPAKQEDIVISSGFIVEEFEPTLTAADLVRLDRLLDLTAADVANYRMVARAGWLDETTDRPLWSVTATETLDRLVATTPFSLEDLWQWSACQDKDGYWNRAGVLNNQPRSTDGPDSAIPAKTQLSCAGSGMRLYHSEPHYRLMEDKNTEIMFWDPLLMNSAAGSIATPCSAQERGLEYHLRSFTHRFDREFDRAFKRNAILRYLCDCSARLTEPFEERELVRIALALKQDRLVAIHCRSDITHFHEPQIECRGVSASLEPHQVGGREAKFSIDHAHYISLLHSE